MSHIRQDIPTEDDLKIPRWARIVLITRTVRRVQPLLLASWPDAPVDFLCAVETAVAEAELAAAQGAVTPDQTTSGIGAMDAYGSRPLEKEIAGYIAYAAGHASFAALKPKASSSPFVLKEALWAAYYYEKNCAVSGLVAAVADAVWNDLRVLMVLSRKNRWNAKSPVTSDVIGPIWPDGPPKYWPLTVAGPPATRPKKSIQHQSVEEFDLPQGVVDFLKSGKNLDYNPSATSAGVVVLKPLSHLRLDHFDVTTEGTPVHASDPHKNERGYYRVRAVDLIGECEDYDPSGILAWFPDYRVFGCWDIDHLTALVFPNVQWQEIIAEPGKYLDAQWNPMRDFAKDMIPWEHGVFRPEK